MHTILSKFIKKRELPKVISVFTDQFFMSVSTLLTTIILARTYSKVDYAEIVLLFSVTLFVLGFQSSIVSKPYAINQNDFDSGEQHKYYQFNLRLKFLFTAFFIITYLVFYFFVFETHELRRFFTFLLYIVSYTFYYFVRETLLSERKTKENLIYGVLCSIALMTLLLVILFFDITNVIFFLLAASAIYLTISGYYFVLNYKLFSLVGREYRLFWRLNWSVGKWLLGSNVFFHLSSGIYPWLLLYLASKDDIAIFGVLLGVAGLVNPVLTALSSYLLPLFVKVNNNHNNVRSLVKRWNLLFAVIATFLMLTGVFFGQKIIVLLYSEKYANLGLVVIYPFIVQGINSFAQPFKIALNALKRTDVNFWVLIPRSFIAVVLGYYLIGQFGLIGAFYTMVVENLVYQICYYMIYRKIIVDHRIK